MALELSGKARQAWLESYIDDLLTHDVEQLEEPVTRRRDPLRLRRYLEAYALNSAWAAEHRTIYEAAEVSKATANAYEDLLDGLLIAERLPAWSSNWLKRGGAATEALPGGSGAGRSRPARRPWTNRNPCL